MTESTTEMGDEKLTATKVADESPLEQTTSAVESYPTGIRLVMILASIFCSVFLVALDRTIIATALPKITDKFQSFADVGWVSQILCCRLSQIPTTSL